MRILVTGCTGFIGSELVKHLVNGHEVYGLVRDDNFSQQGRPLKDVNVINGDLLSPDLKEKVKQVGPDVVIHLASLTPVRFSFTQGATYGQVNYLGTVNLIESVKDLQIKQFIHASTMEAYRPKNSTITEEDALEGSTPYGVSKAAADLYVQVAGRIANLPYTILRPGNTFGRSYSLPDEARGYLVEKAVISMLTQKDVIEFDGFPDRVRSWLYYPDHIAAYLAVLGNEKAIGKAYNVVAEPHSVGDIVEIIRKFTGFKGEIKWGVNPRPYDPPMLMTTAEKFKHELGWLPRYTIAEGLQRVVDYWREKL
jgi:nucleoside-diphosphate-sugar epimerase